MPRLFTAITFPEEVAQSLLPMMGGLRGARWIERGDLHITLRFIGDIDGAAAEDVAAALDTKVHTGFNLSLCGVDAFGGDRPRSVHASVPDTPELTALQLWQERAIQETGLKPERRKFTPHVTLARLRQADPAEVAFWLSSHGDYRSADWRVDAFHLMSARESTGGGPYVPVVSYPLAD